MGIKIVVPARADGDQFVCNFIVRERGSVTELWPASDGQIIIYALPDGKMMSDETEAAVNDLVTDIMIKNNLTSGDVRIEYEANHAYINMLWWSAINRLWLEKLKAAEKPKKSRAKKGGTPQ